MEDSDSPDLSPSSAGERLAGIGEFGLAILGGGPGVAGYVLNRIRKNRDKDIPEYLHAVMRRLKAVEHAIVRDDVDIESDLEEILEKAWSRKQREKRDYWAAAAAQTATNEAPDVTERRRMIDTLDRLRLSHLRLLHLVSQPEPPEGWSGGVMDGFVTYAIPGVDLVLAKLDWSEMHAAGIVGAYPSGVTATPHWQLANQGIPPFGLRFIAFVEA